MKKIFYLHIVLGFLAISCKKETGIQPVQIQVAVNDVKIFKDQQWVCPMGCHLRIENIYAYLPDRVSFKVYIKRDNSAEWVEIGNKTAGFAKYVWTIYNNGLEILEDQTEHPEDTPDIKLVF